MLNRILYTSIGIITSKIINSLWYTAQDTTSDFVKGLNLYRCESCYRLYKDRPTTCKCDMPKLKKVKRGKYKKKHQTSFRERHGLDNKNRVRG